MWIPFEDAVVVVTNDPIAAANAGDAFADTARNAAASRAAARTRAGAAKATAPLRELLAELDAAAPTSPSRAYPGGANDPALIALRCARAGPVNAPLQRQFTASSTPIHRHFTANAPPLQPVRRERGGCARGACARRHGVVVTVSHRQGDPRGRARRAC
jgi:hypothetical protein